MDGEIIGDADLDTATEVGAEDFWADIVDFRGEVGFERVAGRGFFARRREVVLKNRGGCIG